MFTQLLSEMLYLKQFLGTCLTEVLSAVSVGCSHLAVGMQVMGAGASRGKLLLEPKESRQPWHSWRVSHPAVPRWRCDGDNPARILTDCSVLKHLNEYQIKLFYC